MMVNQSIPVREFNLGNLLISTKSVQKAANELAETIRDRLVQLGLPRSEPTGWTAMQSHRGLTGASEQMIMNLRNLDKAFNSVHGNGANLNDKNMKDPVSKTLEAKKRCAQTLAVRLFNYLPRSSIMLE